MTDTPTTVLSTHELLLALAGRVDDDLLAVARELVAFGEDGQAFELLCAALVADRAALPPPVRESLVSTAAQLRIDLDAAGALPPAAPESGTPHRFVGDVDAPGLAARLAEALAAHRPGGGRSWLAWRTTPAGAAPTPLPQPVLLVEIPGSAGPEEHAADVLAYRLAATLQRVGVAVAVEVFVAGSVLPAYHGEALSAARPLPAPGPASPVAPAVPVPAERVPPATGRLAAVSSVLRPPRPLRPVAHPADPPPAWVPPRPAPAGAESGRGLPAGPAPDRAAPTSPVGLPAAAEHPVGSGAGGQPVADPDRPRSRVPGEGQPGVAGPTPAGDAAAAPAGPGPRSATPGHHRDPRVDRPEDPEARQPAGGGADGSGRYRAAPGRADAAPGSVGPAEGAGPGGSNGFASATRPAGAGWGAGPAEPNGFAQAAGFASGSGSTATPGAPPAESAGYTEAAGLAPGTGFAGADVGTQPGASRAFPDEPSRPAAHAESGESTEASGSASTTRSAGSAGPAGPGESAGFAEAARYAPPARSGGPARPVDPSEPTGRPHPGAGPGSGTAAVDGSALSAEGLTATENPGPARAEETRFAGSTDPAGPSSGHGDAAPTAGAGSASASSYRGAAPTAASAGLAGRADRDEPPQRIGPPTSDGAASAAAGPGPADLDPPADLTARPPATEPVAHSTGPTRGPAGPTADGTDGAPVAPPLPHRARPPRAPNGAVVPHADSGTEQVPDDAEGEAQTSDLDNADTAVPGVRTLRVVRPGPHGHHDRPSALDAVDPPPTDDDGDPPLMAELNDPLVGPLRTPLLDPLLEPGGTPIRGVATRWTVDWSTGSWSIPGDDRRRSGRGVPTPPSGVSRIPADPDSLGDALFRASTPHGDAAQPAVAGRSADEAPALHVDPADPLGLGDSVPTFDDAHHRLPDHDPSDDNGSGPSRAARTFDPAEHAVQQDLAADDRAESSGIPTVPATDATETAALRNPPTVERAATDDAMDVAIDVAIDTGHPEPTATSAVDGAAPAAPTRGADPAAAAAGPAPAEPMRRAEAAADAAGTEASAPADPTVPPPHDPAAALPRRRRRHAAQEPMPAPPEPSADDRAPADAAPSPEPAPGAPSASETEPPRVPTPTPRPRPTPRRVSPSAEPAAQPAPEPVVDPMSSLTATERDLLRLLHEELAAREGRPGEQRRSGSEEVSPPDLAG